MPDAGARPGRIALPAHRASSISRPLHTRRRRGLLTSSVLLAQRLLAGMGAITLDPLPIAARRGLVAPLHDFPLPILRRSGTGVVCAMASAAVRVFWASQRELAGSPRPLGVSSHLCHGP